MFLSQDAHFHGLQFLTIKVQVGCICSKVSRSRCDLAINVFVSWQEKGWGCTFSGSMYKFNLVFQDQRWAEISWKGAFITVAKNIDYNNVCILFTSMNSNSNRWTWILLDNNKGPQENRWIWMLMPLDILHVPSCI